MHWYVVRVTGGRELAVVETLNEFTRAWTPKEVRAKRGSAGDSVRTSPLFPNYLFVQCDLSNNATTAPIIEKKARGRILTFPDGRCRPVHETVVRAYMDDEALGKHDHVRDRLERFSRLIGTSLVMPDGIFEGLDVTVTKPLDDDTVEVIGETALGSFRSAMKVTPEMLGVG